MNYNEFRDLCHLTSTACGWWPETDARRLKIPTTLALIHTEIAEAHAFWETGRPDDHLPHHSGLAVELADIVIRTGDNAGAEGVDLDRAVESVRAEFGQSKINGTYWMNPEDNGRRYLTGANAFLVLHNFAASATEAFRRGEEWGYAKALGRIMCLCEIIAEQWRYDLYTIAREKVAYNKTRADHKAEARAGQGGKIV